LRKSRQYEDVKRSAGAPGIVIVILLGVAIYFFVAGSTGKWIGENVVTPVFSFFEETQTGSEDKSDNQIVPNADMPADITSDESAITQDIKTAEVVIYALQTGAFSDEANARRAANLLKNQGGAGYVIEDGEFNRVLISYYLSKDQAVSVMSRLDEERNVKVREYLVEIKPVNIEIVAKKDTIETIKTGFDFIPMALEKIQALSFSFDAGNTQECETIYNDLTINLGYIIESLQSKTNGTTNDVVIKQIELLKTYNNLIADIDLAGDERVAISSKIKYTGIEMIYGYKQLIDSY
jgi:hypothetical protein